MFQQPKTQSYQRNLDSHRRVGEAPRSSSYLPHDSPLARATQQRQQTSSQRQWSRTQSLPIVPSRRSSQSSPTPTVQSHYRLQKSSAQLPQRKPFHLPQQPQRPPMQSARFSTTDDSLSQLWGGPPARVEGVTRYGSLTSRGSLPGRSLSSPEQVMVLSTPEDPVRFVKLGELMLSSDEDGDMADGGDEEQEDADEDSFADMSGDFDDLMNMDSPRANRTVNYHAHNHPSSTPTSLTNLFQTKEAPQTPLFSSVAALVPVQPAANVLTNFIPPSRSHAQKRVSSIVRMEDEGISPASMRILEAVSMRCSFKDDADELDNGEFAVAELMLARERGRLENPFL